MKVFKGIMIALALSILIVACGGAASANKGKVKDENITVEAIEVQDNFSSGNSMVKPSAKNKYVAIRFRISNQTAEEVGVNLLYFALKNSQDEEIMADIIGTPFKRPAISGTDVEAGDTFVGWLVFQIPKNDDINTYRFRFQEILGGSTGWVKIDTEKMNAGK